MYINEYSDFVDYTPESCGNRESDEPVTLELRPMNAGELKRFRVQDAPRMIGENGLKHAEVVLTRELANRVRNVVGLALRKVNGDAEPGVVHLTTGEEFSTHAPEEMRGEVFQQIVSGARLGDALKKSS